MAEENQSPQESAKSLVEAADTRADTKEDLAEELAALAETHGCQPLAQITTDPTRRVMKEQAVESLAVCLEEDKPLSAEEKQGAFVEMVQSKPDARILPVGQAIRRISHPKLAGEHILITVFKGTSDDDDLGDEDVLGARARRNERERQNPSSPKPVTDKRRREGHAGLSIADVPGWAQARVFDLVREKKLKVTETETEARHLTGGARKRSILESKSADVVMERNEIGRDPQTQQPILVSRLSGEFTEPEQVAANEVLRGEGPGGEGPLPDLEHVAPDPNETTAQEVRHVSRRVRECLQNPASYNRVFRDGRDFRKDRFFNQLLSLELQGFTPPRTQRHIRDESEEVASGGLRIDVYAAIKEIAEDEGFAVVGDYVTRLGDRGLQDRERRPTVPTEPIA